MDADATFSKCVEIGVAGFSWEQRRQAKDDEAPLLFERDNRPLLAQTSWQHELLRANLLGCKHINPKLVSLIPTLCVPNYGDSATAVTCSV
jgi:hypothetical protein